MLVWGKTEGEGKQWRLQHDPGDTRGTDPFGSASQSFLLQKGSAAGCVKTHLCLCCVFQSWVIIPWWYQSWSLEVMHIPKAGYREKAQKVSGRLAQGQACPREVLSPSWFLSLCCTGPWLFIFLFFFQPRAPDIISWAFWMQLCFDRVLWKCGAFSHRCFCRFAEGACCFAVWVAAQSQASGRSWILLCLKPWGGNHWHTSCRKDLSASVFFTFASNQIYPGLSCKPTKRNLQHQYLLRAKLLPSIQGLGPHMFAMLWWWRC